MKDWQEFIHRSPDEYERRILGTMQEIAEFAITFLIHIAKSQKVIADTNIPLDILHKIADYNQVAVMLSPHPEKTMKNYLAGIAKINSQDHYDEFANSEFFTIVREDTVTDTKSQTVEILAKHFGLIG